MTTFERFEREIPALMDEIAPPRIPDYLDDMLRQTGRTRQRPAWASLERWLPMDVVARPVHVRAPALRPLLVLMLIGLLVAAGVALYAGTHRTTLPEPFRNGAIVYEQEGEVFIADELGGAPRLLVAGWSPVFSPLGDRVAFTHLGGVDVQVLTVRPDGTDVTELASVPSLSVQLEWAPDGSSLLANGQGIRDRRTIHLIASDGSGSPTVDAGPGANPGPGTWRPNGLHVAFPASRGIPDEAAAFIADADGTNVRQLRIGAVEPHRRLAWSPDGTQLSFTSRGNGGVVQINVADIDATGSVTSVRELPLGEDQSASSTPTWSPDGNALAVLLGPRAQPDEEGSLQVGIFEPDGSGYRIVGPTVPVGSGNVVWSPDGRSLVVQGDVWTWEDGTFGGDLWSVDVATGEASEITTPVDSWQRLAP